MKYKKHIATGALALSLLVSGSNVFAATPQDLGIKSVHTSQKQSKPKVVVVKKQNSITGVVSAITSTGFTVNVTNMKTKATSSVDVTITTTTVYKKDGLAATATDLLTGQKVIVMGSLDKTTNILTAKTVKIVTQAVVAHKTKKVIKTN